MFEGRAVLNLDYPGPELKGSGRRGENGHVVQFYRKLFYRVEKAEGYLTKQIECIQKWLDFSIEETLALRGLSPPIRQARRHDIEMYLVWLDETKAEKARLDSFKPFMPFGTVHTVPGSLENPTHGCIRDWVLFKPFEDRFRGPPRNIRHNRRDSLNLLVQKTTRKAAPSASPNMGDRQAGPVEPPQRASLRLSPRAPREARSDDDRVIVGMVHRGAAKSENYRSIMTYATPMDLINEDIKASM
ncbi:hypothetical protein V492_04205 [Pseudogymnoascus sp. VKM F-4246]|nr:hypothetical protein V492_04205 [Pseudogymnoascus sp. VKM F-4246]